MLGTLHVHPLPPLFCDNEARLWTYSSFELHEYQKPDDAQPCIVSSMSAGCKLARTIILNQRGTFVV